MRNGDRSAFSPRILPMERTPDFDNLLAVLRCEKPNRPTLFEFFLNERLYNRLAGFEPSPTADRVERIAHWIAAFRNAGYDYATVSSWHLGALGFPSGARASASTVSMNEGWVIHDRASFDDYPWPDPDAGDYSPLEEAATHLPDGMKFVASGPGGVLENAVSLVGYENLCYLIADDDSLADDVFEAIGSRLVRYYEHCAQYESVGACISNDDWGFKSQTMFSPEDMRRYVFSWHKRIVQAIHAAGKPAILHSCGNLLDVMDDVIDEMAYDGKHSYEDAIQPVEDAYEGYHDRIATLGGIDLDFICRSTPDEVYDRSKKMLERAGERGSYALGTGNSVPHYVPDEHYLAMIQAALDG